MTGSARLLLRLRLRRRRPLSDSELRLSLSLLLSRVAAASASREIVVGDDCEPSISPLSYGAYGYGSYGGPSPPPPKGDSDDGNSTQMLMLGMGFLALVVLVAVALLWRACLDCCKRSERYARHRAFVKRVEQGHACSVCYHSNDIAQQECVLCGSTISDVEIRVVTETQNDEASTHSDSSYRLMATPHAVQPSVAKLSDRQLVSFERHEWKRCIGTRTVRWVRLAATDVRSNRRLRGTVVQERALLKHERRKAKQIGATSSSSEEVSTHGLFNCAADTSVDVVVLPHTGTRGFVRDDRITAATKWRPVEEYAVSTRGYTKDIQRVSGLRFSEKTRWFYQQSFKLSSSLIEGFHTIRIHREHVLKQSFQIFLAAPTATLRRRMRVDFMEEPGIDGGGILREWVHLICNEVFSDSLGLFALTNSSAHEGYWINRDAATRCQDAHEMYRFFGKVLGKIILEGLLLNARLSIPLLKHILGTPFKLSDVRLLDETVYSSLRWILANDNAESLALNFTVDGVDLIPNGSDVPLTDGNKHLYVDKVMQYYLFDSVKTEIACILDGLRSVVPEPMLHVFDYKELDMMVSGLTVIDVDDWRANTDLRMLGECMDKELAMVEWFWEIVEDFNQDERGRLLQYVTGSSGVPVEGFQGLTGMDGALQLFTIQLTKSISTIYTVLPYASTCLNRLDLPMYESKEELREILQMMIQMDVTGFNSR